MPVVPQWPALQCVAGASRVQVGWALVRRSRVDLLGFYDGDAAGHFHGDCVEIFGNAGGRLWPCPAVPQAAPLAFGQDSSRPPKQTPSKSLGSGVENNSVRIGDCLEHCGRQTHTRRAGRRPIWSVFATFLVSRLEVNRSRRLFSDAHGFPSQASENERMYLVETSAYEQASSHIALASGSGGCSLSTFERRARC